MEVAQGAAASAGASRKLARHIDAKASSETKGSSETTIAIGFLTRGDLPLFSKVPWGATPNPT